MKMKPRHEVQTRFMMTKTEMNKNYGKMYGYNRSAIKGDNYPVTNVSFMSCFIPGNTLSILNGLTPVII